METRKESFSCHRARTKFRDEGWRWFSEQIKITLEIVLKYFMLVLHTLVEG